MVVPPAVVTLAGKVVCRTALGSVYGKVYLVPSDRLAGSELSIALVPEVQDKQSRVDEQKLVILQRIEQKLDKILEELKKS